MRFLILIILLTATALAHAQTGTRYVTDQLEVTLRSGETTQHRIITMLPSGMRLEVLGQNSESGYSHVRTPQGTEGYVLTRYLENTPSARDRLATAEQELTRQRTQATQLREQNKQLTDETTALKREIEQLTRANQELDRDVTQIRRTSASALALDEDNRTLREQLNRLEREHQMLQQQNQVLQDRTARDWFMVGAGVVLLGIIIGLIIPKIRWQRKSRWDRF